MNRQFDRLSRHHERAARETFPDRVEGIFQRPEAHLQAPRKDSAMTNTEAVLYLVGALSIVAFAWASIDA